AVMKAVEHDTCKVICVDVVTVCHYRSNSVRHGIETLKGEIKVSVVVAEVSNCFYWRGSVASRADLVEIGSRRNPRRIEYAVDNRWRRKPLQSKHLSL